MRNVEFNILFTENFNFEIFIIKIKSQQESTMIILNTCVVCTYPGCVCVNMWVAERERVYIHIYLVIKGKKKIYTNPIQQNIN